MEFTKTHIKEMINTKLPEEEAATTSSDINKDAKRLKMVDIVNN